MDERSQMTELFPLYFPVIPVKRVVRKRMFGRPDRRCRIQMKIVKQEQNILAEQRHRDAIMNSGNLIVEAGVTDDGWDYFRIRRVGTYN
jgi:hypothetical protein